MHVAQSLKKTGFVCAAAVVSALLIGAGAAQAAAAGNAKEGEEVFMDNCSICHTVNKGGPNKVGPNLFGVVGRKSASVAGYSYSPAMMKANLTWNEATLKTYLQAPAKLVPGTKMGFPGFSDPTDEANLIAYLVTMK